MVAVVVLSTLLATPAMQANTTRDSRRTPPVIDCGNAAAWPPRDYTCRDVGRQLDQVRDCFERDLVRRPDLGCRVPVLFSVSATGTTDASLVLPAEPCPAGPGGEATLWPRAPPAAESSILSDETIESCIARAARSWRLPARGDSVIVSFMFVFSLEGGTRSSYPFNFDDTLDWTDGMGKTRPPPLASSDPRDWKVKAPAAATKAGTLPAAVQSPDLPPSAIVRAMNRVQPEVDGCHDHLKVSGIAMVRVVIDVDGKVTSAGVAGRFAGTPAGACVEEAVKKAVFPPSSGGAIVYPFRLQ